MIPMPCPSRSGPPVAAHIALRRLIEGNSRFVNEVSTMRARLTSTRSFRADLADHQTPFATVVTCSDSRVPAEIIFDQGLGDLFIIRNAGGVLGCAPLASVEFAVAHLSTLLVLVLAHERCGAIRAAHDAANGEAVGSKSLLELVARLRPAIVEAGTDGTPDERCERAARINAHKVSEAIARSPVIQPLVRSGTVLIVPAYYNVRGGTVEIGEAMPGEPVGAGG